jgi:membrane associated rhomboid family serine protease
VSLFASAPATFVLIALNAAAFLAEIASASGGFGVGNSSAVGNFGLQGVAVSEGEWYRLLTGGFLHYDLLHIGFNMFALYFLGRLLEPGIGTLRFVFLYFASLFGGAFGALLLSGSDAFTIGASGAIFGIFGATFVIARGRGIDAVAGTIGVILLINLAISFSTPRISLGGHLGGLVAGAICALVIVAGDRGRLGPNRLAAELIAMTAVGVISIAAALAIA